MRRLFLYAAVISLWSVCLTAAAAGLHLTRSFGETELEASAVIFFDFGWCFLLSLLSIDILRMIHIRNLRPERIDENGPGGWLKHEVNRIAADYGIKAPKIYVYYSRTFNAQVSGGGLFPSAINMSSQMLQQLDKSQIRAVLAHELSHIKNNDIPNLGILEASGNAVAILSAKMLVFSFLSETFKDETFFPTLLIQLAAMTVGMAVMCWYSRTREYAADSNAAMVAGKKSMIETLKALAGVIEVTPKSNLSSFRRAAFSGIAETIFATHPRIAERILRLESKKI